MVRDVDLRGVRAVDADDLRLGIATQETSRWPAQRPRWLRWWRWWWTTPAYLDLAAASRDRARIQRFYESRGYYDARVEGPEVTALSEREVAVGFSVREGDPVRVADVRLRGCAERGLSTELCAEMERVLRLRPGMALNEEQLAQDRTALREALRNDGWATPVVSQRAMVDPPRHQAWVEYALDTGAAQRSRIGDVRLVDARTGEAIPGATLPNGLPVAPIRSALGVERGDAYRRTRLAAAQQSLFDLGAFSVARIEEVPRADGTVDLDVRLASSRLWRFRLGGGIETDSTRSNVHLLVGYEHRNLLGNFRRLRLELRPQLFFPSIFAPDDWEDFKVTPGVSVSVSVDQPELLRHTSGTLRAQFEFGPDPVNPLIAFRRTTRAEFSMEHRFSAHVVGSAAVRFVDLGFSANALTGGNVEELDRDPLFRQQYFNQRWVDLQQTITWDRRDDRARPRSGHMLTASLVESVRGPFSDYTFVRGQVEARGYVPISRNFVLALRGAVGLAVGETYNANGRWYWPVPPEQRFFLGGPQSLRGYPFNRVGPLATLPQEDGNGWRDDRARLTALGGTAMFQGSAELRWQPGAFGMVLFVEAGNVSGFDPNPYTAPATRASTTCTDARGTPVLDGAACEAPGVVAPAAPAPVGVVETLGLLVQRANPVAGIGLRYMTPIGPVRLDVGFRLDDLSCERAAQQVAAQNAAAPSGRPFFYVTSAPRCDFFGFAAPAVLNLSVGEAY
jgi:outer membrane protein insertion porin family/translocation and assembly module TamA